MPSSWCHCLTNKKHQAMKTRIRQFIPILFFAVFAAASYAQTSIGVYGGISSNRMSSASLALDFLDGILPQAKSMTGVRFGVFTEFPLADRLAFQTGLDYAEKGFSFRENFNVNVLEFPIPVGATVNARMKYFEVPLVAKYTLGSGGVKPYLKAGGTLGYASSAMLQAKARVLIPVEVARIPIGLNSSLVNRLEVGAVIGGGVELPAGPGSMMLDVQYTHGLSSVINTPVVDLKARNSSFGVSIGYKIPIGAGGYGA
jgi:hypothetical protein